MRALLRGPFRVLDESGADRTPHGMKERALLALLLLSPGQRRTRAWLQDKLWSDRGPEQAGASLRQALSQVRRALGPLSARLRSDRATVWIAPEAPLDRAGAGEPLSDLDVRDPEWEEWLRDLRQGDGGAPSGAAPGEVPGAPRAAPRRPAVAICLRSEGSGRGRFVARLLSGRLAQALLQAGDVEVVEAEAGPADPLPAPFDAVVEIETWSEPGTGTGGGGGAGGADAFVLLRTLGPPRNRCTWTGRTRVALGVRDAWEGPEAQALVNRAAQSVADLVAISARASPFAAVQRAVGRIYGFDAAGLAAADALLKGAQEGEAAPLALAWRGFARLTQALEFRDGGDGLRDEAVALSEEAVARAPGHAVVLALAAQVHMKLAGDADLGHHLARRAAREDDANPYALDALSQSLFWQGARGDGYRKAIAARAAAEGLAHSFFWDLLGCLAALGVGRQDEAFEHALSSHRKMPVYRPALRYLLALSLLGGRQAEADHFARRLRALEPDFAPRLLLAPDYPVATLRAVGLTQELGPLPGR